MLKTFLTGNYPVNFQACNRLKPRIVTSERSNIGSKTLITNKLRPRRGRIFHMGHLCIPGIYDLSEVVTNSLPTIFYQYLTSPRSSKSSWEVTITVSFILIWTTLSGQQTASPALPEFDPAVMPIAVDLDSAAQLIVSNYTLIKALKTQMPAIEKVNDVDLFEKSGKLYLTYSIKFSESSGQVFYHNILLYRGLQDAYYVSNQSVTCGSGCQDCKAGCECGSTGSCPPVTPVMRISAFPLAKVPLTIEK